MFFFFTIYFHYDFQVAVPVAAVRDRVLEAGEGVCDGDGLLDRHPVRDADARLLQHPHLQLEDDKGNGALHVPALLRLRRRQPRVRVRHVQVPHLK